MTIYCGTCGYSYESWKGNYFPKEEKDKLDYYSREFNSIEINATFYSILPNNTIERWKTKDLLFSIKAHGYFTHRKLLNIDENWKKLWHTFWTKCKILEDKLGPILFQFPPRFKNTDNNMNKLDKLYSVLDKNGKYAFEFRDKSWYNDQLYKKLKKYNWCLCIVNVQNDNGWCGNLDNGTTPIVKTCDWGMYVRFHGSKGQYRGEYSMYKINKTVLNLLKLEKSLYFYFNNTDDEKPSSAIRDCRKVKRCSNQGWDR